MLAARHESPSRLIAHQYREEEGTAKDEKDEKDAKASLPWRPTFSFPRSAWERKCATLCVASCPCAGRDAERPDVRSHAERGNEEKDAKAS
jgi:hypothetical protein